MSGVYAVLEFTLDYTDHSRRSYLDPFASSMVPR